MSAEQATREAAQDDLDSAGLSEAEEAAAEPADFESDQSSSNPEVVMFRR